METHGKTVTIIISVVIGMVVGGGLTWTLSGMMKNNDNTSKTDSSQQTSMNPGSDGVTVGGAKMVRSMDIVDNAAKASNVTTLVSLVKQADLVGTLKSEGPFTVFGPNNDAFSKLPANTIASLQKPENKAALQSILTYHVVPGTYTSAALRVMAEKGQTLTTVQGQQLMPIMQGGTLMIQDAMGNKVKIQTADVISSNGVTHVIENVLMPKS